MQNFVKCKKCGKIHIRKKLKVDSGKTMMQYSCEICFHKWSEFAVPADLEEYVKGMRVIKNVN